MSPAGKTPASTGSRKAADNKSAGLITVAVSPEKLRAIMARTANKDSDSASVAAASTPAPMNEDDSRAATPSNAVLNATPSSANNDNASESTPNTPSAGGAAAGEGTPAPQPLPNGDIPATSTGGRKKGVKRSAIEANGSNGPNSVNGDPAPRVRSKPGPKKKARLEDGGVESGRGGGAHKLGPKASMGAINAGLRALDRSGKPCRKWAKGGFRLKTFTGVVWEIPRWTAPPKPTAEAASNGESTPATVSAAGSNKENDNDKENTKNAKAVKTSNEAKDGDVKAEDKKDKPAVISETTNGTTPATTNGVAATNGDSKSITTNTDTPATGTVNGDVEMQDASSAQPSPPAEPSVAVAVAEVAA